MEGGSRRPSGDAARRWSAALASWAIPEDVLDAAPECPWGFPAALFARAAERATDDEEALRPSRRRALESLPPGGSVLDVGCGGGAASLPLAPPAGLLVGVDEGEDMLAAFAELAGRRGVAHHEVHGTWPEVAPLVRPTDVVVCHHVFYNVADLAPFALALTTHARRRVVVELTATHPMLHLNPLWEALHGIERPTSPTAWDAVAVLAEAGLEVHHEESERPSSWLGVDRAELVAFARRRLCVGPERDPEIDALLPPAHLAPLRRTVTLWWAGDAGP